MNTEMLLLALGVGAMVAVVVHFGRGREPGTGTGARPPVSADVPGDEEIAAMARAGRKIEAIKHYRALHGVGLKAAKQAVENMM